MNTTYRYTVEDKEAERSCRYIPARYIWAFLLTVLEVLAVIASVVLCCYYIPYFYIAAWITEIACVISIIASDDNPDYKIPWLLFVLILPIAGFMLYFLFYSRKLKRKYLRRLQELKDMSYQKDDNAELTHLRAEDPLTASQAQMLCRIAEAHIFRNTCQTYFPLGEDMHHSILADLKTAKSFIFLEYFIIEEGVFWNSIFKLLKEKAENGVTVKVVYDDIGCMATLPGDYYKTLRGYGIDAIPFSRLKGNADSEFNNRSHRKILVIDGKIGYTGGVNLADEYINEIIRFGHWKDTGIRLEGEAVWELTRLFWIDYGINVRQTPKLPTNSFPTQTDLSTTGFIIPFGDGPRPIYAQNIGKTVIQNMLTSATNYVYMTTPYLIIDNELCQSIENAALRGVDVRIIVPHIPDKKLVFSLTRSFYPRLMQAGVTLYEYEPGFLHAKSYLADDKQAMIGTINLDYRSLVHHFENGVWMYRTECLVKMKTDMEATFAKSIRITPDMLKTSLPERIFRAVGRIFSPLL